ncbi:MAG: alanine--tRNA ligase, partial [Oligoflexia bacterium]|nr:alanine--tRNA ligase [Oligoflexia bacterium]
MRAREIRKKFIDYFSRKGHEHVQPSSLVPLNDPTILFTNAGMNQFKDYFTGKCSAPFKKAISIQKCVRAGGKHNDLENVGLTARHHTFFEMLGNFSFGDYFKKEAITYAWEFLTEILKIDSQRLFVTIHLSDDEAFEIWQKCVGLPKEKIFRKDKPNFWEMGEYGPCGPCSEIYYDHGKKYSDPNFNLGTLPDGADILDDELRYVEIWNLVFMQYEKKPEGTFDLPSPSIDTGMGLERLAAVMQGHYWNYDTDCFSPLMDSITKLVGMRTGVGQSQKIMDSVRVVADHV